MKICYFSCSTTYGGVEKIIVDSLNGLSKTNECLLIVPFGCKYLDKLSENIKIFEYKSYDKRYNPFLYLEVLKVIKSYDIVHTHAAKATQITYLLNKICSFIHVATKHNIRKGKVFNKVKNVISVSKKVSKTITHQSKVLYFGIEKESNLIINKSDIFTIIAVGRLDPIKGFAKLIYEVSKLDFSFQLNIIGEGSQKKELEKLIIDNNLENKVFLLDFKDDIPSFLASSHLQVISSVSEGLPITLVEGIFYSPMIISTPVGGIPEIINENYLVEIENFSTKIKDIYNNYNVTNKDFKVKHRRFEQIFSFKNYLVQLSNYYTDLIKNDIRKLQK